MAEKKLSQQTAKFKRPPVMLASYSIVGKKEGEGPLGKTFDKVLPDDYYGERTWEKAEGKMLAEAAATAMNKAGITADRVDYFLAGDLLNQTISANFAARHLGIPFLGLYGACATVFEGLSLGSMLIDGGFAEYVVVGSSSHYGTAERQFRFPTEQGTQRPLYAQWTVTGAGAFVLASEGTGIRITQATVGKVVDLGTKDANDMGTAMAPAALDTLVAHFQSTGTGPEHYDLIITGDLGRVGMSILTDLARRQGINLGGKLEDCGVLIYSPDQDVHSGGSGCACSAVVLASHILKKMEEGVYRRVLGIGTGALLSTTSVQQGETIPCIGHAIVMEK